MGKPELHLDVIGYGLLCVVAAHQVEITYGEVFKVLEARGIELGVGESRPGYGHQWCNPVKEVCCETARLNLQQDEPLLASLVRHADGTIGEGFATAYQIRYGIRLKPSQVQTVANAEARKCWAHFGRKGW